jgi:hypothetical protein
MPTPVAAPSLEVTDGERAELVRMSRSTSLPHRTVVQAKALLMAADEVANEEIARRSEADSDAVRRWRKRFTEKGPAGVGAAVPAPHGAATRPNTSHPWFRRQGQHRRSLDPPEPGPAALHLSSAPANVLRAPDDFEAVDNKSDFGPL